MEKDQLIEEVRENLLDVEGQEYEGEILDIDDLQGFTNTNVVDGNYVVFYTVYCIQQTTDDKNVLRVAPRTIRRKIQKTRKREGGEIDNEETFRVAMEVKQKNQQKNDKELFNGKNEMEIRKVIGVFIVSRKREYSSRSTILRNKGRIRALNY